MQNIFLGSIPNIEELNHPSFFHYKSDIFCRLSFFFSSKCNQSICFLSRLGIRATVQKIINLSLLIPRVRTNLHFPTNWHSDGAQISTDNEDRIFRCCLPFAQIDRGLEIFTASSLLFRKSFVYKEVKHSRTIQFPVFINTSNL